MEKIHLCFDNATRVISSLCSWTKLPYLTLSARDGIPAARFMTSSYDRSESTLWVAPRIGLARAANRPGTTSEVRPRKAVYIQ